MIVTGSKDIINPNAREFKKIVKGGHMLRDLNELQEAEFRCSEPFFKYNQSRKVHMKQLAFHRDQSKSRWVFGGNRTGKTECGAMEAIWWATGLHPFRQVKEATDGWVVSLSLQVQRDVAQAKILKYLPRRYISEIVMRSGSKESPESGIIDFLVIRNKFGTTSKIGFKSVDQGREKFQGTSLDWVWFDEEPDQDIYEEALLRTLDKGGVVWGTMTPLKGRTWLYKEIYLKDDLHSVHQMSWEDNPFLGQEEIKMLESLLSADVLESRKHGRFMEGTGLVFTELGEENIIDPIDLDERYTTILGIDPGYTAPTGAVWVKTDGEVFYVVGDYSASKTSIDVHSKELIMRSDLYRVERDRHGDVPALIDSAASQRHLGSAELTVLRQFRDHGLAVNPGVNKSVFEGIDRIKSLLKSSSGERRLFLFRNCHNLIREMRGYYWGDGDKPKKKDDHCIDALRYVIMNDIPKTKRGLDSPISSHKDTLTKQNRRSAHGN